ncbi:MAG TPA: hypothetical protein VFK38_07455 [Candidatus Limnocylindrales bacterium]|nr:hypothetical protein [Candidatus Limnocylindrales bacterium]
MDPRLLLAAVGLALGVVLLAWLRRDLARLGAGRRALLVAVASWLVAVAGWLVALLTPAPGWLAVLLTIPAAAVATAPGVLVRLAGGAHRGERLVEDVRRLRLALRAPVTNQVTERRLRALATGLDAWRSADTEELVDLAQEWAFDRLDGLPLDLESEAAREARLDELTARLGPSGPASPYGS